MTLLHWQPLEEDMYRKAWNYVYSTLHFHPNANWNDMLKLPSPTIAWDISSFYNDGFREDLYEDLHDKALNILRNCTLVEEEIIALSWQHEGYRFNPRQPVDVDEFGEWLIPVFPNGDYNFFLKADCSNGIICDGLSFVIACYGGDFVTAFKQHLPNMLERAPRI